MHLYNIQKAGLKTATFGLVYFSWSGLGNTHKKRKTSMDQEGMVVPAVGAVGNS